jgi:AraC-like DNA-binding protein
MGNFVLERLSGLAPVMKTISLPRGRHRLHVMPTTAGCEVQASSAYSWDGQKRGQKPFALLQHTISGAGWLQWEGRPIRVQAGETMLVTIPHEHRYWVEDGGRWAFFWISMSGQEALRVHRSVIAAAGPVLKLNPATVERLASCCLRILENTGSAPGALSALAYEGLMALSDAFATNSAPATPGDSIARAAARLRDAPGDRTRVADLAKLSGYSRAHFSRKFADAAGAPPGQFALNERMRRAAALLTANPRTTIKQIAGRVGFDDPNYFAKVFRRKFAMSPSEFRRRAYL